MKHCIQAILLFCICGLLDINAQQQQESRQILYPVQPSDGKIEIKPDGSYSQNVEFKSSPVPVRRLLRVVGGIKMPGRFAPRGEEFFRQTEFLIDDNLDSLTRKTERYALYFKGDADPFERYAYYRVTEKNLPKGDVTLEVMAKRDQLNCALGGDMGVQIELFYRKDGRHSDDIYDRPDSILYLPIPSGTGDFRKFQAKFKIPSQAVCAVVRLGGIGFKGSCWLESPKLIGRDNRKWSAPFAFHDRRSDNYNYWVGVNLSTRSWPLWSLSFQGKTIFKGPIFDRASDVADFYIPLPADLNGAGVLTLTLHRESHRAAYAYELRSVQLIEESARDVEIVSAPRFVGVGKGAGVLVEINRAHTSVTLVAGKEIELSQTQYTFDKTGLHVIPFKALQCGVQVPITISYAGNQRTIMVEQILDRQQDNVYISSGDEVHIDKKYAPYDYFFKWYVSQRIGNWYQFRPSYQWSGVRIVNDSLIAHYVGLLNALQMPYAWQVEGRTLAASRINASRDALKGALFQGKQAHENDGGYYYWRHFLYNGLFSDFAARLRPYGGIFAKHRPIYTDHGIFIHYDLHGAKDMADGARTFVNNLAYSRGESTRHTGPSTMFRYLYQAGYQWLGAEQMYGPEETIMSSLRGASLAYGKSNYGSLHAMQWGSFPFTDSKHALRLYLSLAVAYMHGSSHINTEEALWTDEYANDRYTESGKRHIYAQHQMLDYIETHSRQGELNSRIAVVQGRNDAWKSFGRGPVWSQKGKAWAFGKAQESFDLLKVFYPGNILDNAPAEGWFTQTPYGTIDLLPIEAPRNVYSRYKAVVFLGWNTYEESDFKLLTDYVKEGGVLLLSAAHLNEELHPGQPIRFPKDDKQIRELIGNEYRNYKEKQSISYGKGKVIYYPQACYPADDQIRTSYQESLQQLALNGLSEESTRGWLLPSSHIGFTVWDAGETRTIYALNVDWQSETLPHSAVLHLGEKEFKLDVLPYQLRTITCKSKLAVSPNGNTTSVLSIEENEKEWRVELQTTASDQVLICNALTGKFDTYCVQGAGKHLLKIPKG